MNSYELGKFTKIFLKRQGLDDFGLAFKPHYARTKARRSKRENTWIKAEDPLHCPKLPSTRTVADLVELFHKLAPETRDWTSGPRSYRVKVSDDLGEEVHGTENLAIARQRSEIRYQSSVKDVEVLIKKALDYADTLLDPSEISRMVKQAIRDRYGS